MSDPHVGSFAVMGCVVILLTKTFTFPALPKAACTIPIYSRLGAAILLNNLPFAKEDGLARMFGKARRPSNNYILAIMLMILMIEPVILLTLIFCLILHAIICLKIFGGITGDLLGAFVEDSEAVMMVVRVCTL